MASGRNGNGRKGGEGSQDVPRWVRTLFDRHEALLEDHARHMASIEEMITEIRAETAEIRTEGEARAAEHRAHMVRLDAEAAEGRRLTREVIKEISRVDAERKAESARNLAEHRAFMAALKDLRGRR